MSAHVQLCPRHASKGPPDAARMTLPCLPPCTHCACTHAHRLITSWGRVQESGLTLLPPSSRIRQARVPSQSPSAPVPSTLCSPHAGQQIRRPAPGLPCAAPPAHRPHRRQQLHRHCAHEHHGGIVYKLPSTCGQQVRAHMAVLEEGRGRGREARRTRRKSLGSRSPSKPGTRKWGSHSP